MAVDLPVATVRRYLTSGSAIPADLAEVTAALVRDALRSGPSRIPLLGLTAKQSFEIGGAGSGKWCAGTRP